MSDDDDSTASSSEGEDINKSGLVATRAKRRTAGNLYETLRANLDDEELQKELLAEDEAEDAEDYLASDREDDEGAMDSSSSDEDAGAAADEDEGERELKKAERAEQRKKRKAQEAKMRIPGMMPKKKVKLADGAKGDEGEDAAGTEDSEQARQLLAKKKKKKSERSNWLPEVADAPTRQSRRELAVKNREVIHANLKESAERSEKQKRLMKDAAKRVRMTDRLPLTQEQRFDKCRRIEKETAKELGRTEREEAERIRLREEALAAKRRREVEGPVMRSWSGSGVFEDGKLKVKRLGSKTMAEYEVEAKKREEEAREEARKKEEEARKEAERREEEAREEARRQAKEARKREEERLEAERKERERIEAERIAAEEAEATKKENEKAAMDLIDWGGESSRPGTADQQMEDAPPDIGSTNTEAPKDDSDHAHGQSVNEHPGTFHGEESSSWLSGIHEYAAQDVGTPHFSEMSYIPSAPAINAPNDQTPPENLQATTSLPQDQQQAAPADTSIQPAQLSEPSAASTPIASHTPQAKSPQPGGLPGTMTFSANPQPTATTPQPPPAPPAPILREQAQRSLLVLSSFPSLAAQPPAPKSRRSQLLSQTNPLEANALSKTLIPGSHPPLTPEESRYLSRTLKRNKLDALPDPPAKPKCAVTGWAARYTDPRTGLPYADMQTYKIVQRMVAGGSAWSGFLGAWVGPQTAVELRLGRPARGVPEGFQLKGEGSAVAVKRE